MIRSFFAFLNTFRHFGHNIGKRVYNFIHSKDIHRNLGEITSLL